jgi:hypothetical protein
MIEKILLNKVVKKSLECQLFFNILTSWCYKLQGILEQPMSTTLVQIQSMAIGDKTFIIASHTTKILEDDTQDCNAINYQL